MLGAATAAFAGPGGTVTNDSPGLPGSGPSALPGLAQFGSIAKNGFPSWYKDKKGVRLEPCLDASDPNCIMGALPDPKAAVTPDQVEGAGANFPDEFFYQSADAGIDNVGTIPPKKPGDAPSGGKATLVASLEGAFANGDPAEGDQMVFSRLRVRVTGGLDPTKKYEFVHPYGTRTVQPDDTGAVFVTEDTGITAGKFDDALKGRVGPFLKWDPDVAPQAPPGYIGDPNVDHPITNGINNYFAIVGPGVGANKTPGPDPVCASAIAKAQNVTGTGQGGALTDTDCISTNLFSLMGKVASNAGVDVKSATYSRSADGKTTIDVRADSDKGQSIVVRDASAPAPELAATTMFEQDDADGNGDYYAHIAADATFANGDRQIEVANGTDKDPQARVLRSVTDEIVDPSATFTLSANGGPDGTLKVTAKSSDEGNDANGKPVALSYDAPAGTPHAITDPPAPLAFAPKTVTITSSRGGHVTVPVHVVGPTAAVSLKADAGDDVTAKGSTVKLLGTRSTGKITSYSWTGPYPLIKDPACAPDAATCAQVVDTSGDPAGVVGTDITPTLTLPTTGTSWGYQLKVTDAAGGSSTDTVIVSAGAGAGAGTAPKTDPLTPGKVRYTATQGRMVIDGTATVRTNNVIHIWIGKRVPADLKGWDATATVDPVDGTWAFDTGRDGMPTPPATDCVSYISTYGDPTKVGVNATLAPADLWQCLPIDGRNLATPLPPAPPDPGTGTGTGTGAGAAAAAAPRAIAGAVPVAGAATAAPAAAPALVAAARVAAPATVTATALATTGVPVNVTVPKGATLLRLRVLTTANKALATTFKKVKAGKTVKVTVRSAKAARKLRAAKRFVVEVRAGTAKNRLGKATRAVIRIRH